MKLAYWMYAGPAHIGTLRVASSFKNVHAIMHAPLGDDYFNVMRSMLERERDFTPVTASIVDRHVLARGSQEKVVENITRKNKEESPDLILLTPTCTSSILQEDLHNFVERSTLTLTEKFNPNKKIGPLAFGLTSGKKDQRENPGALVLPIGKNHNEHLSNGESALMPRETAKCDSVYQDKSLTESGTFVFLAKAKPDVLAAEKTELNKQPDVILADVNHYRVNELQAADRTLEQIVRYYIEKAKKQNNLNIIRSEKPSVNIIGIFTLGFHNQHDCRELKRLFNDLGIKINEIIPEGGNVHNLKNLPQAWFNFVPYREVGLMTAAYLKSEFNMPYVSITPMGLVDTALCIRTIGKIISNILAEKNQQISFGLSHYKGVQNLSDLTKGQIQNSHAEGGQKTNSPSSASGQMGNIQLDETFGSSDLYKVQLENLFNKYIDKQTRFVSQAAWFSRSIDCQNLTGKKAVVFGDATHSALMTKILAREMGIRVSCAGTYCKHDADWFREQVSGFCDQILITDDHTIVGETIKKLEPAAIFGTQMERHVGKRLDIPCGVISAPVHIQNFPLGYRPFLGYEGTNQIADLVYNSFNLGMEDHLLQIFGGHDSLGSSAPMGETGENQNVALKTKKTEFDLWSSEGLAELNKVPGFVRGKVKRNTEKYALQNNIPVITVEVMYKAKEALSNF